ncbi:aminoglycoside phosphotransferase family protein [Frankia sp. AiPa1]|uniref:aminoglycoside phosphotransferase family protein n=1 Tax=Frankia sp. AiPa1 TaxID=573492 RepID=UPI00202B2623|nr:aminoglycoside phosphotransferase family protein [Frankia sp. AiPa1]MCL9762801.1 aminoglycoside phosphotransferase family protein [Frankia sp. AiPa1]
MRQQEDALAVLRTALGAQGVHFDRFDIAYAVLWQRLHPHLRLNRSELAFVEDSSILTDIADTVAGLPMFGTARGLIKLLERGTSDVRRRMRVRRDPTLAALDDLPNSELTDAVTFLFAEDLRAASQDRPYVIIVDSHEALVPSPVRTGRTQLADVWLRDLVAQLDRGLVVIASREPLRWELTDPEWNGLIQVSDIGGLPMEARLELLDIGGISDPIQSRTIADASAGLPFYLNLAVDTHQQTGGRVSGALVSQQEILARFLQNVASEEIRSMEVLSPARIFDYDTFRLLTTAYHLPDHRIAWESLTAYSFVYPAGPALRFHQLMASALRERLSAAATADIHGLLRGLWENRADQASGRDSGAHAARALREAAYHALRSAAVDGAGLLDYTDRAVRRGGHGAARGITEDLRVRLRDDPGGDDLPDALLCLEAEAAVRLGDAAAATALIPDPLSARPIRTMVGARIAVAAGHGQRIAGATGTALDIYTRVWEQGPGACRRTAGLWAADLHMAQGRFRSAESLAAELDHEVPSHETEMRGDVARLRHLAHRFAFDFEAAARYLDEAAAHYTAADSVLGLANIQTNRAELLAHTHPAEAVIEAGQAIEIQREIGARHELGKAYTALAIGQLRCGQLDEAETSLRSACDTLDAVGYRSGRARAEFYRAVLHARRGRIEETLISLRWSVRELEAAEVYPTMILCADHTLAVLGVTDDEIAGSATRARATLQPFGTLADLDARVARFIGDLLDGHTWRHEDLYRQAVEHPESASGFYNHNIRLSTPTGNVIVRIPIPDADTMDLKIWPENGILRALRGSVARAPRLLYAHPLPGYQVVEFFPGQLLDTVAPRGVRVSTHIIDDVVELFGQLGLIPLEHLPQLPAGWPDDQDTAVFARHLSAVTAGVYARFSPDYGDLYAQFGIPHNPLAAVEDRWSTLHRRPFRLLHTDIHRKNMITFEGRTYFLDWELALWGDPVYDLAVHLHKMSYQPDEHATLITGWSTTLRGPAIEGWQPDLETYLAHERIKSAIVDTVRYTKLITRGNLTAEEREALIGKLLGKLAAAHTAFGSRLTVDHPTTANLIQQWARRRA